MNFTQKNIWTSRINVLPLPLQIDIIMKQLWRVAKKALCDMYLLLSLISCFDIAWCFGMLNHIPMHDYIVDGLIPSFSMFALTMYSIYLRSKQST